MAHCDYNHSAFQSTFLIGLLGFGRKTSPYDGDSRSLIQVKIRDYTKHAHAAAFNRSTEIETKRFKIKEEKAEKAETRW